MVTFNTDEPDALSITAITTLAFDITYRGRGVYLHLDGGNWILGENQDRTHIGHGNRLTWVGAVTKVLTKLRDEHEARQK